MIRLFDGNTSRVMHGASLRINSRAASELKVRLEVSYHTDLQVALAVELRIHNRRISGLLDGQIAGGEHRVRTQV